MRRVYRRKRPLEYLTPFLIFVGIGVIGVLGFQLWNSLQGAKGDVYFYVASGKAKLLQYGTKEWETAYSGTKLLLGDSVKTGLKSRGILQFFNGTTVRLSEDTEIVVTDITKRNDVEKIGLTLNHGAMWVNKVQTEGVDQSDLQVRTTHMQVSDVGTVFEVESNGVETVRVMKGNVNVQILDNDGKNTVLDTIQVGVGQELNLDEAILKAFQNHETPSVLMALSDTFKLSDWYLWNGREDESPTDFSIHHDFPALTQETSASQEVVSGASQQTTQQTDTVNNPAVGEPMAVISNPSQDEVQITNGKLTVSGTVSPGVDQVVIRQTLPGSAVEEYALKKFKKGDSAFSFNIDEAYGNLKPGRNVYQVVAVAGGIRSTDITQLVVNYEKAAVEITDALTAPKVLQYNGSTSSTTTTGVVKVEGEVHGADKVVVNGYTLGKFVSGSSSWVYYANEQGGNLTPGVNNYEVYAVDPKGNKSAVTAFTITYNKLAGSTSQASSGTSSSSTTQQTPTPAPGSDVPNGF